jgi:hypothetical protein
MCHKVNNNRPPPRIEQPSPISPERPTAGIQSQRGTGMPQEDSFDRGNCRSSCKEKKQERQLQKLMKKLEKLFEKIEKLFPAAGEFARDMVNAIKREKDTPVVNDVADRVRRTPALPSPR